MNTQLNITYLEMSPSESTDFVVREQVEKIERHCPSLALCEVVITAPKGHIKGGHFEVAVKLECPNDTVFANKEAAMMHSHEDCHSAIRDVFRAALRELDDKHDRKRSVQRHPE